MTPDFSHRYGPWTVVTGASDGIGRAFSSELARRGLNLVLVARRGDVLEAFASELVGRHGVEVRTLALDLTADDACDRLLETTLSLDVGLVVAAAGYGASGPLLDSNPAQALQMVDLNCRSVLELAHGFAPRLASRGRGGLVMMSSLLGWQGVPHSANYAATKAYVQSLAEGLHEELKPLGVDVVACAPGPVRSGFADRAGLTYGPAERPTRVARVALDELGRKTTVVPGVLAKSLTASMAVLPRRLRVKAMGKVIAKMAHTGSQ